MEAFGVSELIARIVGPVYVIISFSLMAGLDTYRKINVQFVEQEALSYLAGMSALALGVTILTVDFVWRADRTVLLTMLGCIATAKGAALVIALKWLLRTIGGFCARPVLCVPVALRRSPWCCSWPAKAMGRCKTGGGSPGHPALLYLFVLGPLRQR
jgi:hypothetical protein